ncbi:MAG: ribosome maturation factor RimM [Acidimicrobiia bacterium]
MVGTVIRPHGLTGEVLVFLHTDSETRFRRGQVLMTSTDQALTVASSRSTGHGLLVRFSEIVDRNASEALGKVDLLVDASTRRSLGADEYWPDELIGLEARDQSGARLGIVTEIDDSSSQTRLMLSTPTGVRLIPLVTDLVPEVNITDGFLVVRTIPGLLNS